MVNSNACPCCKVTKNTYRKKFFERWPTGYPFQGSDLYYCANYEQCGNVMQKSPNMQIDHIIPQSANGPQCIDSLRPMCSQCNQKKGADYGDNEDYLYNSGADNVRVMHKGSVIAKQNKKKNQRRY
jgi:5-methylcytosine-specific restriction endonuclease McrA